MNRVIVIGLDGLEPSLVEPLLKAGKLPNLAALAERGGSGRVRTTTPAQTPVAWSTFATGVNPGGHGIFDFLRRNPASYQLDIALNRYERKNAFVPPRAVNLRRGVPVWDLLAAKSLESTILRCPCTYPPEMNRGRMLSGMGVPDVRGGFGTPTFYTTGADASPQESELLVKLEGGAGASSYKTHLIGPRNPKDGSDLKLPLDVRAGDDAATIVIEGSPSLGIKAGVWSDWLPVKFKTGAFQSMRGIVRFFLVGTSPELELYASPVNFDPASSPFPISAPPEFAEELAGAIGPFATTGMVEDHGGLNNDRFDEDAFLAQCDLAWREREAMMVYELERFQSGLFYCLYDTPDRVQHMFWRFGEPDHPALLGRPFDLKHANVIEDQYRRCDAVVGQALEFADDDTLVIALSDHGFGTFRRGVDLNAWLHQNGLLALKPGVEPGHEAGDLLRSIDWGRTKAYAVGLGGIYLNMKGRERDGIVSPDEAEAVKSQIANSLGGLKDDAHGITAVRKVVTREQAYSGPYLSEAPDLIALFEKGYRADWLCSMGGVGREVLLDNTKKWSGDHIIDPALVPGVLFMNRPFRGEGAGLVDLAPTILDALGVDASPTMEGRTLLS